MLRVPGGHVGLAQQLGGQDQEGLEGLRGVAGKVWD